MKDEEIRTLAMPEGWDSRSGPLFFTRGEDPEDGYSGVWIGAGDALSFSLHLNDLIDELHKLQPGRVKRDFSLYIMIALAKLLKSWDRDVPSKGGSDDDQGPS